MTIYVKGMHYGNFLEIAMLHGLLVATDTALGNDVKAKELAKWRAWYLN